MNCKDFEIDFSEDLNLEKYEKEALNALDKILLKNGKGSEMLGWVDISQTYDKKEYERMKDLSKKVRKSNLLVVIGVGGSFLGAKAVIESLKPYFKKDDFEILFCGNDLSSEYLASLCEYIKEKDFYINVISKSGSTFETALAFRVLKVLCEKKYKEESKERIIITTDLKDGILRKLVNECGYESFSVPKNIGGRFSALTAVGLFPIMCAGIDTDQMLKGVDDVLDKFTKRDISNPCVRYATFRNILFRNKKQIEYLIVNEPKLKFFQEWFKQLFSESEGKDAKGLYVESAVFTRDLHSFGQMIQDGNKIIFETFIDIAKSNVDLKVPFLKDDFDKLNYLSEKSINDINKIAVQATRIAHIEGNVSSVRVKIPQISAYNIGKLIYFFEMSCAISAYMLGVNPFDQPGVDNYKRAMYNLLEKMN